VDIERRRVRRMSTSPRLARRAAHREPRREASRERLHGAAQLGELLGVRGQELHLLDLLRHGRARHLVTPTDLRGAAAAPRR
jgi:hypothetical protein